VTLFVIIFGGLIVVSLIVAWLDGRRP